MAKRRGLILVLLSLMMAVGAAVVANKWVNGQLVPWDDCNVHVLTHGLHYGSGVFEGIRCYETKEGAAPEADRNTRGSIANRCVHRLD